MSRFFPIFLLLTVHLLLCTGCGSDNPTGPEEEPGPRHDVGDLVIDLPGGVKMALIWIEPGTFMMGAREGEPTAGNDRPRHQVTLSKGFYMAKYELVWQQWMSVMREKPKYDQIFEMDYPIGITRVEAVDFANKLNDLIQSQKLHFRLPTEAEWEYACRAGTTTFFSWGNETDLEVVGEYAWYDYNTYQEKYYHVVGQKKPNPWGLYDMHGNASEWVEDWYSKYPSEPQVDPVVTDPPGDDWRFWSYIIRGGDIAYRAEGLRCAERQLGYDGTIGKVGFRIVAEQLE